MKTVLLALLPCVTGLLPAQHPAGLLTGVPPAGTATAVHLVGVGHEAMLRVPAESYRGLGGYVVPGSHRIRGAVFHLHDLSVADGEIFDVHVYLEAGSTNLPTIPPAAPPGTTAVASVMGLTTPPGVMVHEITVVFPTPVDVPVGKDVFISVAFQTPGLNMFALGGTSLPGFIGLHDACGAGLPLGASYMLVHGSGTLTTVGTGTYGWQPLIDLLVDGVSGVAVSAIDGAMPPTASLFSGLHPDSADPPNQTARHDVPGYLFLGNGVLSAGSPVFLLASTDGFTGFPWIVLSPGAAVLHLSPATVFPSVMAIANSAGNALLMWPVPQVPELRGLNVSSQAFAFDIAAGAVRAGAAVRQRF